MRGKGGRGRGKRKGSERERGTARPARPLTAHGTLGPGPTQPATRLPVEPSSRASRDVSNASVPWAGTVRVPRRTPRQPRSPWLDVAAEPWQHQRQRAHGGSRRGSWSPSSTLPPYSRTPGPPTGAASAGAAGVPGPLLVVPEPNRSMAGRGRRDRHDRKPAGPPGSAACSGIAGAALAVPAAC